jgi:hypothetical protein
MCPHIAVDPDTLLEFIWQTLIAVVASLGQ